MGKKHPLRSKVKGYTKFKGISWRRLFTFTEPLKADNIVQISRWTIHKRLIFIAKPCYQAAMVESQIYGGTVIYWSITLGHKDICIYIRVAYISYNQPEKNPNMQIFNIPSRKKYVQKLL